jgi:1-acyl-sn-glycerol-3-phosphate acyltransferase
MSWYYRLVLFIMRTILRLFYGLKVYGLENTHTTSAIIAPNHASYLDPPIVSVNWPVEMYFLASDYLFKVPIFGAFIRKLNSRPIHRGRADLASMKMVCQLLQEGKQVLIFPEGARTCDGDLSPLKSGTAVIMQRTKCAIIPVYIYGSYKIWNRHSKFPKLRGKLAAVFGKAILFDEFSHLEGKVQQKAILERLQEDILGLKQWYDNGATGPTPQR